MDLDCASKTVVKYGTAKIDNILPAPSLDTVCINAFKQRTLPGAVHHFIEVGGAAWEKLSVGGCDKTLMMVGLGTCADKCACSTGCWVAYLFWTYYCIQTGVSWDYCFQVHNPHCPRCQPSVIQARIWFGVDHCIGVERKKEGVTAS